MKLADKTIINVLAKSSEAFMLLISSVVFVRYLSKADYGTFLQIMLIINTSLMLTFLGIPQSIYYYFHIDSRQDHFIIRNIVLSLFIGASSAAIIYFIGDFLARLLNNNLLADYNWITALIIFFRAPSALREPILISSENLLLNALITLLNNLIIFIPAIIAAMMNKSLETILTIMLLSASVDFIFYLILMSGVVSHIRKNIEKGLVNLSQEDISLKRQLIYALPIGASSYMGIIAKQIDQYIVSAFFLPTDFAIYSRGAMQIPVLSSIQFTINNIMMPEYVRSYKKKDSRMFLDFFHKCIEKTAKIKFPVFTFMFAVSPSFITLLYTEEYVDANWIFRCYLFFLLINITVYGIIPRASGKTGCIMYATVVSLLSNIILSLFLIKFIGALGAALATIISTVLASGYYLYQSCKILEVSFRDIFPWEFLFRLFGLTIIAAIPVVILESLYHPKGMNLAVMFGFEWLIYTYICIFLLMRQSLIYQEDIDLLERWLHFDVKKILCRICFIKNKPLS